MIYIFVRNFIQIKSFLNIGKFKICHVTICDVANRFFLNKHVKHNFSVGYRCFVSLIHNKLLLSINIIF